MKPPPNEEFWTNLKQERRRIYWIFAGIAAFGLSMPFAQVPEHYLAIGVACVTCLIVIVFAPGRWFCRSQPQLVSDRPRPELAASGPRPGLRKQPPPVPERPPVTHWPLRTEPLPPLPPRPRRR